MKRFLLSLVLLYLLCIVHCENVTFRVNVPEGTKQCYVVGDLPELSAWAAGSAVPMTKVDGKNQFVVTIEGITASDVSASLGYKYVCGPDWKYVEVTSSGSEMSNRINVGNPDEVAGWRNVYSLEGIVEKWTIANKDYNVQILLPNDYDKTKEYDVTYMFGRHQRYRNAGSDSEMGDRILYSGSWSVADSVANMQKRGVETGIIVVIYAQLPELTPWVNDDFMGTGGADEFLDSFVNDFKSDFEAKYSIVSAKENCTIMGADVAGLFAFYASLKYPNVFGACGMFSPSFWYNKKELVDFVSDYEPEGITTKFVFASTVNDVQMTFDDIAYFVDALEAKGYTSVIELRGEGMHDDLSWGRLFPSVFENCRLQITDSRLQIRDNRLEVIDNGFDASAITWTFMKGEGTTTLECEGSKTQQGYFYKDGKTPTVAQIFVKEIPVDGKKYSYYWNMNSGKNCDGELLLSSPKDIGFKSSRSTISWQRVAIFADGSCEQSAASATNFSVNGVKMTVGENYEVSAEVSLTDDKTISVHYGSVNSGSDMGELVSTTVSDNCLEAKVTYSYLTNKLSVEEIEFGSSDIDLVYFKAEPAVVRVGVPVKLSVKIANKNGYNVSYRMNHNNTSSYGITLTQGESGEEYYILNSPESGIYGFYLDIELNGTKTKAHRAVYLKVLEGETIEPVVYKNPYKAIDWAVVNQYKSNLHTHTTQSNDASDNFNTAYVVGRYHAADYKILSLTDHDYNPYPWTLFSQYMPGVAACNPEELGMLAVPGNELSKDENNSWDERLGGQFNHHNDFFTGRQGQEFASLEESYAYTYALGGLQIINHPGQYWNLNNTYSETDKNGPGWHANNFKRFPSLVGLEVYNQGNRRENDRILWDQIMERTMPEVAVFGYSGDDAHNDNQLFRNYNFMLMEDLTIDELKDAMLRGESYFCYEVKGSGEAKAPRIELIEVNEEDKTITIEANGLVHWIFGTDKTSSEASSRRSTIVGIGNTFSYAGYQGSYVRAFITNAFGETCTQPISFVDADSDDATVSVEHSCLDLFVYPNPVVEQLSIFMNKWEQESLIEIFDLNGKLVMTKEVDGPQTIVSVECLESGVYVVKVGAKVEKFVKK